jgi:hypothetical protein
VAAAALAIALLAPAANAADPLNAVRAFCQADGRGVRLDPRLWPAIAPLVSWGLEPAWDHLVLIRGFQLGTPIAIDGGVDVEVQYTVTAEVRSSGVAHGEKVETRILHLERDGDGAWRVRPPAPPPHLFESDTDADTLAALLAPEDASYVSNSAFVWRLLRDAGWLIAYADTADLGTSTDYTTPRTAEVGDLVLYYDGDQPYHVAIVESEDTVVSATLNGGIRRTPYGAFAGEIRYRRPAVAVLKATATSAVPPSPTPRRRPKHR